MPNASLVDLVICTYYKGYPSYIEYLYLEIVCLHPLSTVDSLCKSDPVKMSRIHILVFLCESYD